MHSLRLDKTLYDLNKPSIMGIVNVTPDSFYSASRYRQIDHILDTVESMLADGTQMIDVGGQSSRPGAERLSSEEECSRVIPVVKAIRSRFPEIVISIDTFYGQVAEEAFAVGADLLNDISAWSIDTNLLRFVSDNKVPYVLMHMQGQPQTMQKSPIYSNISLDVYDFFTKKISILLEAGCRQIFLDPGFGFGKTVMHNYELISNINAFKLLDFPMLIGVSRKSMIWKLLNATPDDSLNGTSILNTLALLKGASILRVHDTKPASELLKIWDIIT